MHTVIAVIKEHWLVYGHMKGLEKCRKLFFTKPRIKMKAGKKQNQTDLLYRKGEGLRDFSKANSHSIRLQRTTTGSWSWRTLTQDEGEQTRRIPRLYRVLKPRKQEDTRETGESFHDLEEPLLPRTVTEAIFTDRRTKQRAEDNYLQNRINPFWLTLGVFREPSRSNHSQIRLSMSEKTEHFSPRSWIVRATEKNSHWDLGYD